MQLRTVTRWIAKFWQRRMLRCMPSWTDLGGSRSRQQFIYDRPEDCSTPLQSCRPTTFGERAENGGRKIINPLSVCYLCMNGYGESFTLLVERNGRPRRLAHRHFTRGRVYDMRCIIYPVTKINSVFYKKISNGSGVIQLLFRVILQIHSRHPQQEFL